MKFTRFKGGDISVETTGSASSLSTPRGGSGSDPPRGGSGSDPPRGGSGSDPRVHNLIMLCSTQRMENVRLSLSNVRLSLSNVRLSLSNVRLSLSKVRLFPYNFFFLKPNFQRVSGLLAKMSAQRFVTD